MVSELKQDIEHLRVPKKKFAKKKTGFADKRLDFIYLTLIKFTPTDKVKGIPMSKKSLGNIGVILNNQTNIHHPHVSSDVTGHVHSFYNWKVRENKCKVTVVAHNLFRFDFFFLWKGLRAGVWRRRDISIGGKNPTDVIFASIGNQVMFLDTIKYFQQSLEALEILPAYEFKKFG